MAQEKSQAAQIREQVVSRKGEIRSQLAPLQAELDELLTLVPDEEAKPEQARSASPSSQPRQRRRRKGGTREEQAIAFIADNPGASASDVAKHLKIKPNYLYRVLSDAEKDGKVRKNGRAYEVVAS